MNFLIVSGLSGSGKTIALQALEDMGYYCIDNLPAMLLPHFAGQLLAGGDGAYQHAAVSIDSRNRSFLATLPENLAQVGSLGLDYSIIFLESEERVLIKRFSETRRKHPLTDQNVSLLEAVRMEKELLAPLAANATKHIDTTFTTPHELRALVRNFAGAKETGRMSLLFESFGYKYGAPLDADFVFDVRCLPNPHWQPALRELSGLERPVIDFLQRETEVEKMIDQIRTFLESWLPSFEAENRSYITVGIGCTGGRHRSPYIADRLARYFGDARFQVQIRHRELA